MPELLASLPWIFAAAPAPEAGPSPLSTLLPFLPIPFLFYFLMIRPKQLEDRKRLEMIGALKKNDKVVTTAGIYGTVVSTDPDHDRVVLRVDDDRGVKLTFSRSSVLKVVETSQDKEKAAESA
jgi:preprotein translocase subunit YajC